MATTETANLSAIIPVLFKENDLLSCLLSRNKSQHRRSDFFRNLSGASSMIKYLKPDTLHKLTTQLTKPYSGGDLKINVIDNALYNIIEAVQRLRRASWSLRQQIAAGYFMSFCVALLAIVARMIVLLQVIVKRLLSQRRSLDSETILNGDPTNISFPAKITSSRSLSLTLEWLLSYGNALPDRKRKSRKVSMVNTEENETMDGTGESLNDLGECVAFAPPSTLPSSLSASSSLSSSLLEARKSINSAKLATDYSDSEVSDSTDDGGPLDDQIVSSVERKTSMITSESPMKWFVDTGGGGDVKGGIALSKEIHLQSSPVLMKEITGIPKSSAYSDSEESCAEKEEEEKEEEEKEEEEIEKSEEIEETEERKEGKSMMKKDKLIRSKVALLSNEILTEGSSSLLHGPSISAESLSSDDESTDGVEENSKELSKGRGFENDKLSIKRKQQVLETDFFLVNETTVNTDAPPSRIIKATAKTTSINAKKKKDLVGSSKQQQQQQSKKKKKNIKNEDNSDLNNKQELVRLMSSSKKTKNVLNASQLSKPAETKQEKGDILSAKKLKKKHVSGANVESNISHDLSDIDDIFDML